MWISEPKNLFNRVMISQFNENPIPHFQIVTETNKWIKNDFDTSFSHMCSVLRRIEAHLSRIVTLDGVLRLEWAAHVVYFTRIWRSKRRRRTKNKMKSHKNRYKWLSMTLDCMALQSNRVFFTHFSIFQWWFFSLSIFNTVSRIVNFINIVFIDTHTRTEFRDERNELCTQSWQRIRMRRCWLVRSECVLVWEMVEEEEKKKRWREHWFQCQCEWAARSAYNKPSEIP